MWSQLRTLSVLAVLATIAQTNVLDANAVRQEEVVVGRRDVLDGLLSGVTSVVGDLGLSASLGLGDSSTSSSPATSTATTTTAKATSTSSSSSAAAGFPSFDGGAFLSGEAVGLAAVAAPDGGGADMM